MVIALLGDAKFKNKLISRSTYLLLWDRLQPSVPTSVQTQTSVQTSVQPPMQPPMQTQNSVQTSVKPPVQLLHSLQIWRRSCCSHSSHPEVSTPCLLADAHRPFFFLRNGELTPPMDPGGSFFPKFIFLCSVCCCFFSEIVLKNYFSWPTFFSSRNGF